LPARRAAQRAFVAAPMRARASGLIVRLALAGLTVLLGATATGFFAVGAGSVIAGEDAISTTSTEIPLRRVLMISASICSRIWRISSFFSVRLSRCRRDWLVMWVKFIIER